MGSDAIVLQPVGQVIGGRRDPTDDYWGGTTALIRIDGSLFPPDAAAGLEEFTHLEIVFQFHRTEPGDIRMAPRRPRDNAAWPVVGVLGHRNMRRPNRLGISRCRLIRVDGLDLHVEDLDAIDGTPVIDVKPWFDAFGPRGDVREPTWSRELTTAYFAPPR